MRRFSLSKDFFVAVALILGGLSFVLALINAREINKPEEVRVEITPAPVSPVVTQAVVTESPTPSKAPVRIPVSTQSAR